MEVLSALVCDSASDYQGKLCILGAFDTIMASDYPVVHPTCSIALRMLFRPQDEGRHQFDVLMIDSDGHQMLPPLRHELVIELPPDMYFTSVNLVFNIQGLAFQTAGQYSFDVRMDDKIIARIPLQAVKAEQYA